MQHQCNDTTIILPALHRTKHLRLFPKSRVYKENSFMKLCLGKWRLLTWISCCCWNLLTQQWSHWKYNNLPIICNHNCYKLLFKCNINVAIPPLYCHPCLYRTNRRDLFPKVEFTMKTVLWNCASVKGNCWCGPIAVAGTSWLSDGVAENQPLGTHLQL